MSTNLKEMSVNLIGALAKAILVRNAHWRASSPDEADQVILSTWRLYRYSPEAFKSYVQSLGLSPQESARLSAKMFMELNPTWFTAPVPRALTGINYFSRRPRKAHSRRVNRPHKFQKQLGPAPAPATTIQQDVDALGAKIRAVEPPMVQREVKALVTPLIQSTPKRIKAERAKPGPAASFTEAELEKVSKAYAAEIARQKLLPLLQGRLRPGVTVPTHWWTGQLIELRGERATKKERKALATAVYKYRRQQKQADQH
jgi:hypothetical protein